MTKPWRFYLLLALFALFATGALFAQQHESQITERSFPTLRLPEAIFSVGDEEFTRVARRIQDGSATMQERRWFYRAAERYAPFTAAPPRDWKVKADAAGKKIATYGTIYRWGSLGPNGDYDVTLQWGPSGARTQGRATAVWTHMDGPNVINKNIIFLGFADGGVWKTVDGGDNWTPLTDYQPTLSIGALDVVPGLDRVNYSDATIYVGTGEGNFSVADKDGVGVLKSTDGGKSWTVQPLPFVGDSMNIPGQHRIRRLRVDTRVPGAQSVWVAGDGGVYRTTNGGTSWSLVTSLPYAGQNGGCWMEYATDINIGPVNPANGKSILFATFSRHRDATCVTPTSDSRKNTGIYRSTDGGATWQKITISATNGFGELPGVFGRMQTFLAPSNPKRMYVLTARSDTYKNGGIYTTADATADPVIWTAGATTNFCGGDTGLNGQCWYNLTGAIDPTNENRILVGGLDNFISNDAAKTLTKVSGWSAGDTSWSHADHHHAIWVDANTYYDANDGGLNIGHVNGNRVTWTHKNIGGMSTLQFYGLGQSATEPYRINAGLQDNGHAFLDNDVWKATAGGDGGFACTDQDNDQNAYSEYVYGSITKSNDGGATWPTENCMQSFGACTGCLGLCVPDQHMAFIANFILDTHNQNVMYAGTNVLYRNIDARNAGKVWERVAPAGGDFVNGSSAASAYVTIIHTAKGGGATTVPGSLAGNVSKVIYVGTSTGRIWKTTDGGLTWTDLTKAPLPVLNATAGRVVTWIDSDPTNADNVVVTYSGWNISTPYPGHVFRSNDGGATWVDISGVLPDEPFNTVAVSPNPGENNEAYVGSDSGVYVNTNVWNSNSWMRINGVLPHVSVNMLQFSNATTPKRLRAATHGRGIWEMEKGNTATITLDKSSYGCSDSVAITVQDGNRGAGSVNVTISSTAERDESLVLVESPANSGRFIGSIALVGTRATGGDGKLTVLNVDTITAKYRRKANGPASINTFTTTATTDCDVCGGSTAAGPNLRIVAPSIAVEGGDGDEFLDNCETGRVNFSVKNVGGGSLTNLRISRVTSSNPNVKLGAIPQAISPAVAQCTTTTGTYRFTAAGLSPREELTLNIELSSDEMAAQGITKSFSVTYKYAEQDFVYRTSKTYTFEGSADRWQLVSGTFAPATTGGGANSSASYMASSSLANSQCDNIRSPEVKLTATSALTMYNQFMIEPMNDAWYDRANVGLYDLATGTRNLVIPSGLARPYLADGPKGTCVSAGQRGWAGAGPGWLPATFSAVDLGSAARAGRVMQIDVGYGTDPLVSGTGFWFDDVTLTDFWEQVDDTQGGSCPLQ